MKLSEQTSIKVFCMFSVARHEYLNNWLRCWKLHIEDHIYWANELQRLNDAEIELRRLV